MSVLTTETTKNINKLFTEVSASARYLTDKKGGKTDVVLPLTVWTNLLALLEDLDDRRVIQEWLPQLKAGPESSKALRWNDVAAEWGDDEKI